MYAAKAGVELVADLKDFTACPFQSAADHASAGAVHGVDHNILGVFGNDVKIDQLTQVFIVHWHGIEARDQFFFAGDVEIDQVGSAPLFFIVIQVHFHFSAQVRQC